MKKYRVENLKSVGLKIPKVSDLLLNHQLGCMKIVKVVMAFYAIIIIMNLV